MADNIRVLDLDALTPKPVLIKFNGGDITVQPPTVEQFMKAQSVARALHTFDKDNVDVQNEKIAMVTSYLVEVIPELEGKALNLYQILALISLITELSTPKDEALVELKNRGIDLSPKAAKKGQALPKG